MKNGIMWFAPYAIIGGIVVTGVTCFLATSVRTGLLISLGTLVVGIVVTMLCLTFSYCLDDKPQGGPRVGSKDGVIVRKQRSGFSRVLDYKGVIVFGIFFLTGFIGRNVYQNYGLWASAIILFMGFLIVAGIILLDSILYPKEGESKDDPTVCTVNEVIIPERHDTSLEYLAENCQASLLDGLVPNISSIVKHATKLLGYQKDNGVVGEILQAYRVFIEQYVAKAAELIRKYQIAKEYLSTTDCHQLSIEIGYLQTDIESGDASAKTTLEEKLTTKAEIEAMQKRQESIGRRLGEIAATLEAMEAMVVSAETSDADAKDVRDELQRTLSSTTQAIKETLCD